MIGLIAREIEVEVVLVNIKELLKQIVVANGWDCEKSA